MKHLITIDELDELNGADRAFAAYCTDECGFAGVWRHADNQDGFDPDDVDTFDQAQQDALHEADRDGWAHLAEFADSDDLPEPDVARFSALSVPLSDEQGYALPITPADGA